MTAISLRKKAIHSIHQRLLARTHVTSNVNFAMQSPAVYVTRKRSVLALTLTSYAPISFDIY